MQSEGALAIKLHQMCRMMKIPDWKYNLFH